MEIVVANHAGACFGVNRSLELLMDAVNSSSKVATLGSIIHNPQTVENLKSNFGVQIVDSADEAVNAGVDTVVIRSHGTPIQNEIALKDEGINVIDATCPHVKNVQKTAQGFANEYGAVLVIGKAGHPEVDGVLSYVKDAGADGYVVNSVEDLHEIFESLQKYINGIGIVCQTTQSVDVYDKIIENLRQLNIKFDAKNTICSATQKRQQSAKDSAKSADIVLVLGGLNSSNTTHLKDICQKYCDCVYHIESPADASEIDFHDYSKIVICAGASTPQSQIKDLIQILKNMDNN